MRLLALVFVLVSTSANANITNVFKHCAASSFNGDGGSLTNVTQYAAVGFINMTLNGSLNHFHPHNAASHPDWRVVAWRPTRNIVLRDISTYINYASHVDTNYCLVFTNGTYTGRMLSNYVGTAGSTSNVTLSTNTAALFIGAGTRVTFAWTNQSNSSRQIYGEINFQYQVQ